MKYTCGLCNSHNVRVLFNPFNVSAPEKTENNFTPTCSDYGIFHKTAQCKNCGILFSMQGNQRIDIRQLYLESKDNLYLSQIEERQITCKRILSDIKKFGSSQSRLLDIGCSYGLFLNAARTSGMTNIYGVEMSKDACVYCKDTLKLNVFCGNVQEAAFPDNYFDIICAIEVIEHLENPRDFILRVNKILKPGGILYIATPNTKSLSGKIFGWKWWSYRRMHLYYFSQKTLDAFLNTNGFTVLSAKPYKKTFKISYILRQLSAYNKTAHGILSRITDILQLNGLNFTSSFGDIVVTAQKMNAKQ